jgi:antitoxin component of MazEF toxin-antitoxin module
MGKLKNNNIRKIRKQNSSYVITIPPEYLKYCKLSVGSPVWINLIDENTIIIKKIN